MNRKIFYLIVVLIFNASFVMAHSPRDLQTTYLKEEKILDLKMVHVTNNRHKHFIRKIEIIRQKGAVVKKIYYRQKTLKNLEYEIPIELMDGENITIKVFSTKGGVLTESFTVPAEEKKEDNALQKE